MKNPPLHILQALEQANTQTHEGCDNKHQDQGIAGDSAAEGSNPGNTRGNHLADIGKNSCNSNSGSLLNTFFHFLI